MFKLSCFNIQTTLKVLLLFCWCGLQTIITIPWKSNCLEEMSRSPKLKRQRGSNKIWKVSFHLSEPVTFFILIAGPTLFLFASPSFEPYYYFHCLSFTFALKPLKFTTHGKNIFLSSQMLTLKFQKSIDSSEQGFTYLTEILLGVNKKKINK